MKNTDIPKYQKVKIANEQNTKYKISARTEKCEIR